jgi:glycosyltransferase involved in cell wall biosynthesis
LITFSNSPRAIVLKVHQILVSKEFGGAGLIGLHVAEHLRRHGIDSQVWIPGEGRAWSNAEKLGISPRRYDAKRALGRARSPAAWANWRLGTALRKAGGGLVHVHSPLFYGALSKGLSWARVRRVCHVHLEENVDGLRWAFRNPPELIVTCARFLVGMVQRSLPENAATRVVAVPNAVDTSRFAPGNKQEARRHIGDRTDRPLLVMLANLAAHKGHETAIRMVALLRKRGIEASLWLAGTERGGETSYTAKLQRLLGELGVADLVSFLGQREDAAEIVRAADCFLLPSTHEGLPLSVLEAQASGTVVLAAPTAGVPEVVIDGETGFLIPADDATGYADRFEQLLRNPGLGNRIVENALVKTRRDSTWSAYCERMKNLYAEVLESRVRCSTESPLAERFAGVPRTACISLSN